jgi:sialidase-1
MRIQIWTINKKLAVFLLCGALSFGFMGSFFAGDQADFFRQDVFVSGQDGYHTYRIPALVLSANNTLLAFCEGRKCSASDEGDIDLLLKRSKDGGKTWSEQIVVHEEGGKAPITIGNPCPIVERNSARIHLFFTRNNKRLFYTRSMDDGLTWAAPKELTDILKGLDYPMVRIATGPGLGIQMKNGQLVAPVWVSDRERKDQNTKQTKSRFQSSSIYSDDNGETWKTGSLVPPELKRLNECAIVEKNDGSLLLNARAYYIGFRAVSLSKDGSITWSNPVLDKNLPDPTCQASMIRLSEKEILFLNPTYRVDTNI